MQLNARNIAPAAAGFVVAMQFVAGTVTDLVLGALIVGVVWAVTRKDGEAD